MKKLFRLIILVSLFLFIGTNTFAATYSIFMENLPDPSEIETIFFVFDVGDDFVYTQDSLALGEAAPPNSNPIDVKYPWVFGDSNPAPNLNKFLVDAYNSDILDTEESWVTIPNVGTFQTSDGLYNENNLQNGLLLSFEYVGSISLFEFSALNSFAEPVSYASLFQAIETPEGLIVSTVPIPPALLLFGSGIIGMLGLRRKFNK